MHATCSCGRPSAPHNRRAGPSPCGRCRNQLQRHGSRTQSSIIPKRYIREHLPRIRARLLGLARRGDPIVVEAERRARALFDWAEHMESRHFHILDRIDYFKARALLDVLRHAGHLGKPPAHPTITLLSLIVLADQWFAKLASTRPRHHAATVARLVCTRIINRRGTTPKSRKEDVWATHGHRWAQARWRRAWFTLGRTLLDEFEELLRAWGNTEVINVTDPEFRAKTRDHFRRVGKPYLGGPRRRRRST